MDGVLAGGGGRGGGVSVYIVTAGSYSQYHICAVYDTKEAAEYHVEHLLGRERDDAMVEEYELNPHRQIVADRLKPFVVEMGRDGTTYAVCAKSVDSVVGAQDCFCLSRTIYGSLVKELGALWPSREEGLVIAKQLPMVGMFHVLATDEQHAVKIANERRARLIAENGWPESLPSLSSPWQSVPMVRGADTRLDE